MRALPDKVLHCIVEVKHISEIRIGTQVAEISKDERCCYSNSCRILFAEAQSIDLTRAARFQL